ncbi:hypothetical protein AYO41_05475 [Verrucomicrobia bacterium SCGC AG-212-E04]|nr:hypothetical protein AYO41_05475 [Verrucomicrobia bacterium SCGC AG-212-E04]
MVDWMMVHGVGYVFALRLPGVEESLNAAPNLTLHVRHQSWLVYRLERTYPLAYIVDPDTQVRGVPVRFRGNTMEVAVERESARLQLNIFPLPNLQYRINLGQWQTVQAVDGRPFVPLTPAAQRVEVTLKIPSLSWTVPVSVLGLLGCVGCGFSERRQPRAGPVGSR